MINAHTIQTISVQDWDDLVEETYGRPYSFQQQDGCKERGVDYFTVPIDDPFDFENESITEETNGDEMGVSFAAWLARDPTQQLDAEDEWDRTHGLSLFWRRNFYPTLDMIANNLHGRGLIPAGEYQIVIDW